MSFGPGEGQLKMWMNKYKAFPKTRGHGSSLDHGSSFSEKRHFCIDETYLHRALYGGVCVHMCNVSTFTRTYMCLCVCVKGGVDVLLY